MDAESYDSDTSLDSGPLQRLFGHENMTASENMVETEKVLFTNSILTVNLVPALVVTAFGLAGFAFFLWLMGYDLVRQI